jgi:hypothetical protein
MVEPAPHGGGKSPRLTEAKRAGPKREGRRPPWREGSRLTQGGPSSGLQAAHAPFSRNGKKPVSGLLKGLARQTAKRGSPRLSEAKGQKSVELHLSLAYGGISLSISRTISM